MKTEEIIDTTRRYPRTLRDAWPDKTWRDCWQSAEAAVAEEDHIRAMFSEPPGNAVNRAFDQATRMVYVIAVCVLAWVFIAWAAKGFSTWAFIAGLFQ